MIELQSPPQPPAPKLDEATAERRVAQNRFDVEALLARADHLYLAGNNRAAASFYAFAAKSFDPSDPRVKRAVRMRDWLAHCFRAHIVNGVEVAGFDQRDWPPRFREALDIMFGERERDLVTERYPQIPTLFYYPGLPYVDFADPTQFPWREEFENCFAGMRDEACALLADTSDFAPYVTGGRDRAQQGADALRENADWSSLYLWADGRPVEQNATRCPTTFGAIKSIVPLCDVSGLTPMVLFSLLRPGAHIPPHTGMLNIHYICHLPLVVPRGCSFRVGEKVADWVEGRLLVFDDTVEHEARNGSDRDRLILIFDVWNPHLGDEEKLVVKTMLEVVQDYR